MACAGSTPIPHEEILNCSVTSPSTVPHTSWGNPISRFSSVSPDQEQPPPQLKTPVWLLWSRRRPVLIHPGASEHNTALPFFPARFNYFLKVGCLINCCGIQLIVPLGMRSITELQAPPTVSSPPHAINIEVKRTIVTLFRMGQKKGQFGAHLKGKIPKRHNFNTASLKWTQRTSL